MFDVPLQTIAKSQRPASSYWTVLGVGRGLENDLLQECFILPDIY